MTQLSDRLRYLVIAAMAVTAVGTGAGPGSAAAGAQQVPSFTAVNGKTPLDWASDMVEHVSLSNTSYSHAAAQVTWSGQHGATEYISHADCSSFLEALLTQAYGVTAEQFRTWLGKRRPYAKDFYDAIEGANGFTRLSSVPQLKPGDIIAIRYVNSAPGDNTGHIMVIAGTPERRTATKPIVPDTEQWDVAVIDSSESGHGKTDTRRLPDGKLNGGAGRGILRLYSDRRGALVGYAWSDLIESVFYDHDARPIVIGRLAAGR